MHLYILVLLTTFLFSEDFRLTDLNQSSDFHTTSVGPSSFPGEVSIVYFGHYN